MENTQALVQQTVVYETGGQAIQAHFIDKGSHILKAALSRG